jgi:hypothetical protein
MLALVASILGTTIAAPTTPTNSTLITRAPPRLAGPEDDLNGEVICIDEGSSALRRVAIEAIDNFCIENLGRKKWTGEPFQPEFYLEDIYASMDSPTAGVFPEFSEHYYVITSMRVKPGCKWDYDGIHCMKGLRECIDRCNTGREDDKQGGFSNTNCVVWRVQNRPYGPNKPNGEARPEEGKDAEEEDFGGVG